MITSRPDVIPDGIYSQAQAAAALKVNRHTVKRYEENGRIKFRVRKADNRRVTTGSQIIRCWECMYL